MILPIFSDLGFVWQVSGVQYRGREQFGRETLWPR